MSELSYQALGELPVLPSSFTAAELSRMRFPPVKHVVPRYIPEGVTLLAGKPKFGKSWFCLEAAVAIASGGCVLCDVQCEAGDVLYLALEDNPRRIQSRMRRIMDDKDWPERLTFRCDCPTLDKGGIDLIKRWIEGAKLPRIVFIDTFAKVRGSKSEQSSSLYEADYAALRELHSLARDTGVAVVIVHHVRKMDAEDPIDTVSGTTGLTGAVDTILVFRKDGNGSVLYGRGRDVEEFEIALRFDSETCRWEAMGDLGDVQRSEERRMILDVRTPVQ